MSTKQFVFTETHHGFSFLFSTSVAALFLIQKGFYFHSCECLFLLPAKERNLKTERMLTPLCCCSQPLSSDGTKASAYKERTLHLAVCSRAKRTAAIGRFGELVDHKTQFIEGLSTLS